MNKKIAYLFITITVCSFIKLNFNQQVNATPMSDFTKSNIEALSWDTEEEPEGNSWLYPCYTYIEKHTEFETTTNIRQCGSCSYMPATFWAYEGACKGSL